jgi:hypothetical protein
MFRRLLSAAGQSRSAKTVEIFGWLILIEGTIVLFTPDFAATVLGIAQLNAEAANYFRLVGLLVCGIGMLYIASGRLNAQGFVFASLLDRPLVPLAMAILVSGDRPGRSRVDLFDSGFRQLSVDSICLAQGI